MVRNLWFGPCRGLGLIPGLGTKTQESASHSARAPNPPPHKSNLTGAWDEVRKLRRQVCPQTSGWGIWLGLTGNEGPRTGDTAGLQKPPWDGHAGKGSVGKCPDPTQTRTRGCVLRRGQDVPRSPGPQGFVGVRPVQGEHQALVMRVGTVPHSPTISPAEPLAYQSLSIYQVCRRRGLPSSPTFGFRRGAARGQ